MQLYILVNGEQQGPYSPDQIKGYLAIGQIQHTDLGWHEGLPEWKPLGEFPEFAQRAHRLPNYGSVPIRSLGPQKSKKRRSPLVTALFLLIIVAVAGGAGYYGYQYWNEHRKSGDAVAPPPAPTASGLASGTPVVPKALEELDGWSQEPPPGQNAATFFQQGFDALQITDADRTASSLPLIGKGAMPSPVTPLSATMKSTLRAFLERNQPALDLFERGAQCSGSRYPIELAKGFDLPLPHLTKVRQSAQLSESYALSQADSRSGTNASRGVLLALASARTLELEPLLTSQLVRVACQGIAVDALEQTLNRIALPPETLTQLQSAFGRASDQEAAGSAFDRAVVVERVNGSSLFDQSPEKMRATVSQLAGSSNLARQVQSKVSDKMLSTIKEQRQFCDESFDQVLAARKESLPGRLKADELITTRISEAKSKDYLIATMVLPASGKVTSREAGALARLRLAQAAVALEQFRIANANRYPDSLAELAPKFLAAVPNDPFDGQPLRYQKGAQGYVLHSIGADLKDDAGVRKPGSDDLLFFIVRPPKAM